ncbi:MAG: extracellular solute-binding protein [Verrucomicrobiae bacterium]|nr:extracellular solute-binding protein [Verrucomicrobiae bacterium]
MIAPLEKLKYPAILLGLGLLVLGAIEFYGYISPPLRLMVWMSPEDHLLLKERLAEFSATHGSLRVQLRCHASQEECAKAFLSQSRSGNPPDVCLVAAQDIPLFRSKNLLVDLAPSRPNLEGFLPPAIEAVSHNKSLYAIPCGWSVVMLYYNRTLFEQHGIPFPKATWDWGDLLQAAQTLTVTEDEEEESIPLRYGLELPPDIRFWAPLIWQNRGQLIGADGLPALLDPQFAQSNRQAMDFYAGMVREYHVAPPPAKSRRIHGDLFVQQKAAMVFGGRELASRIKNRAAFRWDAAPLPKGVQSATWLDVYGFALSSKSRHAIDARQLIDFLTSETSLATLMLNGQWSPPRRSLLKSKVYLDFPGPRGINHEGASLSLGFARLPPPVSNWRDASILFTDEMAQLMASPKIQVRTSAEHLQARLDELNLLQSKLKGR